MKLRIRDNSIRLRLGRSEVARLLAVGSVTGSTTFDVFGQQTLEYQLVTDPTIDSTRAVLGDRARIVIQVPTALAQVWGTSGQIELTGSQPIAGGQHLRILVEKDLECLDAPPTESQADAFARPDATKCGTSSGVGHPDVEQPVKPVA